MFLDLLKEELGSTKHASGETRFCCPFCGETDHKFYVENTKGLWICFKCEEKGNPVSFVMKYYGVPYPEAVDILATYDYDVEIQGHYQQRSLNQYGSDLTDEEKLLLFISRQGEPIERENKSRKLKCPSPPTNCKSLMQNFNSPEAFPFFAYLHKRGVTLDEIQRHNISYVTHGTTKLLDGRELELVNHLVFFTFDENNKPIYWNTRSIEADPFIKSFNAPSREDEYSKNNTVFNLNNAVKTDKVIIHEGVFDAFMTPGSGVATFGKMITDEQIDLIVKETNHNQLPIYLFLDSDAWEQMIKAAQRFKARAPYRRIYFVYNPYEEDANSLGMAECQKLVEQAFLADSEGEMKLRLLNM